MNNKIDPATKSKVVIVTTILILSTVLIFTSWILLGPSLGGAIAESMPSFCLSMWLGFLAAGPKEKKARIGAISHSAIFLFVYLIAFLPIIYTQSGRMFDSAQQQNIGKAIVFFLTVAVAAFVYYLAARFSKIQTSNK